ncbi:MAG TPA: SAM-dependent methyltransferase [Actinomycetota bacterium]|nr:SAM-dependent methyltransferase [Actinomycetota bacterium]
MARTKPLHEQLVEEIRARGPITFAEFMDAALYDPDQGFYATPPIGEHGDFVTSPHVSPAFGSLVARQLAECWEILGRPNPFTVVEIGAGDGTLGRQLRVAVTWVPAFAGAFRYAAVERSPGALRVLREHGLETRTSLDDLEPVVGCILANEVLDNVPFHRLRYRDGRTVEVMVGANGERLTEEESEPTADALAAMGRPLQDGEERPVSPAALAMVRDVTAALERGYAFLFDYGFRAEETPGPVHAYRDHRVLAEVLEDPGSRDVTAAVDLDAVAAEAREAGLQVWGPITQREALLALGYRTWSAGVQRRQNEAQARHEGREASRLFEARSRASILIDPAKLGGLYLLALGTEGLPPPVAVLGDREAGC